MEVRRVAPCAREFFRGEREKIFEVAFVARSKKRVGEHLAERGRDGQGEARRDALVAQLAKDGDERQVDFGDRFEEPVLFEEFGVLGVAHEGEMRVEDKAEVAGQGGGQ